MQPTKIMRHCEERQRRGNLVRRNSLHFVFAALTETAETEWSKPKENHTKPTKEVLCGEEDRGRGYGVFVALTETAETEWSKPGLTTKRRQPKLPPIPRCRVSPIITCTGGRWVASPWFHRFQRPTRLCDRAGRPAIRPGSPASLISDVGLNGL